MIACKTSWIFGNLVELRIFFNFLFVLALLGRTRVAFCLRLIFTHHWDKTGLGWTPGVGDGQGGLVCCGLWDRKESDKTEQLNWIETKPFWVVLMSREQGFSLSLSVSLSLSTFCLCLCLHLSPSFLCREQECSLVLC